MFFQKTLISCISLSMLLWSGPAEGSTSGAAYPAGVASGAANMSYQQGLEAMNRKDYANAVPLLQQALMNDPNNPDIMNNLAFCLRKTGDLDNSLVFYRRALLLRPKFPQAHEYLGEAYVEGALKEIETLKSYGPEGEKDLKDLVQFLQAAAAEISQSNAPQKH